jgi:hypothetical protein
MRAQYLPHAFQWQGKSVLLVIGALQFIGWLLAGLH